MKLSLIGGSVVAKSKVYRRKMDKRDELMHHIMDVIALIKNVKMLSD
jgi:hypothetical protein